MNKKFNKIGIIGAMGVEIEALAAAMENVQSETFGRITLLSGSLCGQQVVLAKCGGQDLGRWPEIRVLLNKHCGYELKEDEVLHKG